jgi:hypothetical protein
MSNDRMIDELLIGKDFEGSGHGIIEVLSRTILRDFLKPQ